MSFHFPFSWSRPKIKRSWIRFVSCFFPSTVFVVRMREIRDSSRRETSVVPIVVWKTERKRGKNKKKKKPFVDCGHYYCFARRSLYHIYGSPLNAEFGQFFAPQPNQKNSSLGERERERGLARKGKDFSLSKKIVKSRGVEFQNLF